MAVSVRNYMTAAKDRKKVSFSFKSASLDQLWSCLQRCLLFDEPSGRWSKLIAQTERLVSSKSKDLSSLSLRDQQNCFKSVFGTPDNLLDNTARMFNLIMAIQDLRLFEAEDFDIWFFSQSDDDLPLESDPIFKKLAAEVLQGEPTEAQAASLAQAWDIVPYWRVLESFGPWAEDPLADFVGGLLRKFDMMQPSLQVNSILNAESEFAKLLQDSRSKLPANFQPPLLVLVEGNTEAILLPRFLKLSGSKSSELQPAFIPCGGANQVLRKYLQMRDISKLPILCVMDHDAEEQIATIRDVLRKQDKMHIWSVGEIEDTFPAETLLESLNTYLQQLGSSDFLNAEDLSGDARRTELLDKLWRSRGLGDFDKVGFAEFQVVRLKQVNDIPAEGKMLMETIKGMMSAHDD